MKDSTESNPTFPGHLKKGGFNLYFVFNLNVTVLLCIVRCKLKNETSDNQKLWREDVPVMLMMYGDLLKLENRAHMFCSAL